jgi:fructokinase
MSTARIVAIGEALIDLIQQADGSYQAKPGGAAANLSIALARLGADVAFAGRTSTDGFGEKIFAWLSPENIDLSTVERTGDATTLAVATLDEEGKASYSFYLTGTADWGWTPGSFDYLKATPPAALVIGSVAVAIEPGSLVIEDLARDLHAREASTVVIDLNIRPGLGFAREAERTRVERQISLTHLVKASDEDLEWLYPERSADETARLWASTGLFVIMTRGADGATLVRPAGEPLSVAAPRIVVADTVGAGDSFLGATLLGLSRLDALGTQAPSRLAGVSDEQWGAVLLLAANVGAITCSRAGCNPPTLAELGLG